MTTRSGGREIVVGLREIVVGVALLVLASVGTSYVANAQAIPALTKRVDHLEEKWEAMFTDIATIKAAVTKL